MAAHDHCPKGAWKRAGSNLCIHLDHGEPDDFQGALEHCRDDRTNPDPKRDWAHLITVKNLLEILSQPARHFSHEIWINAVLYGSKWYQIMKVPLKPQSSSIKDYIEAGYAEAIGNVQKTSKKIVNFFFFLNFAIFFFFFFFVEIFHINSRLNAHAHGV